MRIKAGELHVEQSNIRTVRMIDYKRSDMIMSSQHLPSLPNSLRLSLLDLRKTCSVYLLASTPTVNSCISNTYSSAASLSSLLTPSLASLTLVFAANSALSASLSAFSAWIKLFFAETMDASSLRCNSPLLRVPCRLGLVDVVV